MKPEDVERQKILEGYGYRFLRINRFTMGVNPVKTLDERLRRMLDTFDVEREPPSLIEEYKKLHQSLSDGNSKACSRCDEIKPNGDFFDPSLNNGDGGFGRICVKCKSSGGSKGRSRKRTSQSAKNTGVASSAEGRTYLKCPYSEKDECKRLGGKWDPFKKRWYVPPGKDSVLFARWL